MLIFSRFHPVVYATGFVLIALCNIERIFIYLYYLLLTRQNHSNVIFILIKILTTTKPWMPEWIASENIS